MTNIQSELIKYFESLRDKCKDPKNKAEIQKEIDRIKFGQEGQGIDLGNGYLIP